jgi:hypothetical protein
LTCRTLSLPRTTTRTRRRKRRTRRRRKKERTKTKKRIRKKTKRKRKKRKNENCKNTKHDYKFRLSTVSIKSKEYFFSVTQEPALTRLLSCDPLEQSLLIFYVYGKLMHLKRTNLKTIGFVIIQSIFHILFPFEPMLPKKNGSEVRRAIFRFNQIDTKMFFADKKH